MIVVIAHLELKPGTSDQFEHAVPGVITASLTEGAISYEVHRSLGDPTEILFVEEWADRQSLDRHFQTPHFKEFDSVLSGILENSPRVVVHEVASSENL